jgi:phosphoribosylformylglycinamidine synthase subunit PurQ / glutaminase
MKSGVIVFPGSNREMDMVDALTLSTGQAPKLIWHRETELPDLDLIVLPGGFSYGDYLRSGAMAARSPVMNEVIRKANDGVAVLGVCNGFQMLTEAGLLPGALMRNRSLKFICRDVYLKVDAENRTFSGKYSSGQVIRIPVAHHDGNYFADADTLDRLEGQGRVGFRYCDADGNSSDAINPNGSARHIAGVFNEKGNVLGMMPHPENHVEALHGCTDGKPLFDGLAEVLS